MTPETILNPRPWYREPWPWIVIAGPAAVVVAGAITIWLAVSNADDLVTDDYYRQGLAINKVIAREATARRLGLVAHLAPAAGRLQLRLAGAGAAGQPPALFVHFAHATRAGYDTRIRLAQASDGRYEADLPALPPGRWRLSIEDPQGAWRIAGTWSGVMQSFTLGEAEPAARSR